MVMWMHRIHREVEEVEVEEADQQQVDVHILETGILEMEVKYTIRRRVGKVKGEADQDVEGDRVNDGLYTLDSVPGNYCKNCSKVLQRLYEKRSHRQSIIKPENLSPWNDQPQPLTQASSDGSSSQISLHTSDAKDERSPKFYTFTNSDDSDHKVEKKHHSKNHKKNRKHKKKKTKSGHGSVSSSHQHD
ncbi:hypothetical protein D917_09415 [Trichinella nativa]|uniref:Uncharacterized protein n=1 Tax=Trichinella nativa TaxID=6335 RepID=A0A1Y3ELD0_9BILA|nr:hypothetical protein D917_09415 [Trichinella nativa]